MRSPDVLEAVERKGRKTDTLPADQLDEVRAKVVTFLKFEEKQVFSLFRNCPI
jgi:hypothetical protein